MRAKRSDKPNQPEQKEAPQGNKSPEPAARALLPGVSRSDSGQPQGNAGRIDVTGIIPEGIRIDPDITEGHPGYEESGDSEIIPPERLTRGESAAEEGGEG